METFSVWHFSQCVTNGKMSVCGLIPFHNNVLGGEVSIPLKDGSRFALHEKVIERRTNMGTL